MKTVKIVRSFGILNRTYLSYMSKSLSKTDISYSESIFLMNIGSSPGISQEELAGALAIDKAAVARAVKNLEQKGYITIKHISEDKRVKSLYITDSGNKIFGFIDDLNLHWIDRVMGNIDKEDFIQMLEQMTEKAKNIQSE